MTVLDDVGRHLRWPAFVFLVVTVALQVADLIVTISPITPTNIMWRFNALGSAASMIGNVMLLILLLFFVSLLVRANSGLALVALLAGIVALCCFLGAGFFILDSIQLRGKVEPQVAKGFVIASAQALWRFLVYGLIAVLFATSSFTAWRARRRESRRVATSDDRLIMRASSGARVP